MPNPFDDLVSLMARLRAPDGCPWDRKQTHESLKPYLLEETYEVLEAIDTGNPEALKEELGDLLVQILFHAQIESERSTFTVDDVVQQLAQKLIRRHPHVFNTPNSGMSADQVTSQWESIKTNERKSNGQTPSPLDGVPKTYPALLRAFQIQARASRVGFDWSETSQVREKLDEELGELHKAIASESSAPNPSTPSAPPSHREDDVEHELGDVLFTLTNLARFLHVNPEEALRKATNRFIHRFQFLEARANQTGRPLKEVSLAEMDLWWEEAKKQTNRSGSH